MTRKQRALTLLDGADLYLNVVYAALLLTGIDLLIVGKQETTIDNGLPDWAYILWIFLHFAVPASSWAGQMIHYRRRMGATGRMPFSWELRAVADAGLCLIAITAMIATAAATADSPDSKRILAVYVMVGLWALTYIVRDLAHIVYRECPTRKAACVD